jgi:hypothetical protein
MKEKTVKDHEGKKHPADTARPGGAAYAPHGEGAEKLAAESTGDNRTPDKTIGEIKYAKKLEREHKEPTGGAGDNRTPELDRERPMKEKTVKDHEGKKQRADAARPGGAAYAPHDEGAEKLATESTGDSRTPDKTIGEIKYAKKPEH